MGTSHPILGYVLFHWNLNYSSIEKDRRAEVIRRCYWPLLHLGRDLNLPIAIEASGQTLEIIEALDPALLHELRELVTNGRGEFLGSGYCQLIAPLVPPSVNVANLRLGHLVYERLLGHAPKLAYVNEQAWSDGLVGHYLGADYEGVLMEWENAARFHAEWHAEWRYRPCLATSPDGQEIPLIWTQSIAFQRFQRYAHDLLSLPQYLAYIRSHASAETRLVPVYSGDGEVFDLRPGRYADEPILGSASEWGRIRVLLERLREDEVVTFVGPSEALAQSHWPAPPRVRLSSPEQPIAVKKQPVYNVTRWAVTGRADLALNTRCHRVLAAFEAGGARSDDDWRRLLRLWASDLRTHITFSRWHESMHELRELESRLSLSPPREAVVALPHRLEAEASRGRGRLLAIETSSQSVVLDPQRGLALQEWLIPLVSDVPMVMTLPQGTFDDISMGVDFYSGCLVLAAAGRHDVTDLSPAEVHVDRQSEAIVVTGRIETALGPILKQIRVERATPRLTISYHLGFAVPRLARLRLGHITLNPHAFDAETLYYETANGSWSPERFELRGRRVDHGSGASSLVTASQGLGMTNGRLDFGDSRRYISARFDPASHAWLGMIKSEEIAGVQFCQLVFSAQETDDTSLGRDRDASSVFPPFHFSIIGCASSTATSVH